MEIKKRRSSDIYKEWEKYLQQEMNKREQDNEKDLADEGERFAFHLTNKREAQELMAMME